MKKQALGEKGEALAAAYLKNQGYAIVQRNYRSPYGEIDLIATKDQVLVFIEVKTRTNLLYGSPEEAITARKKQHIRKSAMEYLRLQSASYRELRFDVIAIFWEKNPPKINHIEAAF